MWDTLTDFFQGPLNYLKEHPEVTFSGIGIFLATIFGKFIWTILNKTYIWVKDGTAMGKHKAGFEKTFSGTNFMQRLPSFVEYLKKRVYNLNHDANWGSENFTELDAEVEVRTGNSKKKKVTNLLKAIKYSPKNQAFLIIGDPGSGKSVALRKLCEDLLSEVKKTKKIPLYVNLKEWVISEKWSENAPPTAAQLYDFIFSQLKGQTTFSDAFIEDYFLQLFQNGHLYLIFDSFDEIPMVLDVDETNWIIDKLSEVIFSVVTNTKNSGGILASRRFRKPTLKFRANIRLYIRPFTAKKIKETLLKSVNFNSDLLHKLFNERYDLVSICTNPFAASLLAKFVQNNGLKMPQNQAELYRNYIENCLNDFKKYSSAIETDKEELFRVAQKLSYYIFESDEYGLEIPLQDAKKVFGPQVEECLLVFNATKIGRIGQGFSRKFSFVHRRFYEFFVAQELLTKPGDLSLGSIPADSRWRDSLVLYCEVAPYDQAKKIADFCWNNYILKLRFRTREFLGQTEWIQIMHTFRFLAESFKNRKECLNEFHDELSSLLSQKFYSRNSDILELNILTQGIALLPEDKISGVISGAFKVESKMISEASVNSCRYLSKLEGKPLLGLLNFYSSISNIELITNAQRYLFPLKLSNSFNTVYLFAKYRIVLYCIRATALLALFILNPLCIITYAALTLLIPKYWTNPFYSLEGQESFFNRIFTFMLACTFLSSRGSRNFLFLLSGGILISNSKTLPDFGILSGTLDIQKILLLILLLLSPSIPYFLIWKRIIKPQKLKFNQSGQNQKKLSYLDRVKDALTAFKVEITKTKKPTWEDFMPWVKVISFGAVIAAPAYIFRAEIIYFFKQHWTVFFSLLGFVLIITFFLIKTFKRTSDLLLQNEIKRKAKNDSWNRIVIGGFFFRFKTKKGRYKFVKYLYDEDIQASGEWRKNILPSKENDDASDLLAQLDAKWLGIDR